MLLIHGLGALFMQTLLMTFSNHLVHYQRFTVVRQLLLRLLFTTVGVVNAAELAYGNAFCDGATTSVSVHCGRAPSATVDNSGKVWVTFVQDKHVYVSNSLDGGASFSIPVKVNSIPEDAEFNGENRPKIIVTPNGEILLSWTLKTSPRYTGEIRFSRSADGGRSFSEPKTINDDELPVGHRFESMFLTKSGHLYLAWIDKRELHASSEAGEHYAGAAIYYAVSTDYGRSFSRNHPVSSNSCECCRIAVAPSGDEGIAILWRQIFNEEIRDHAFAVLMPDGDVSLSNRASYDDWYINACPHHGPAMTLASSDDEYHMTWFSNGNLHQGIYYARYNKVTGESQDLLRVDGSPGAGHPDLVEVNDVLYLVWKGFDGKSSTLKLIKSYDNGQSWAAPESLFSTEQASDYPLLVRSGDKLYLSWHSDEFGYQFKALTNANELSLAK